MNNSKTQLSPMPSKTSEVIQMIVLCHFISFLFLFCAGYSASC